ncbi:hypothetical protein AB0C34_17330 [Nocardia sp. NPDC049220]|uniref:hypothetical protein n=1 Tax=Nocardia sp. NPDC049220 TaxID=3155273 RepID=UPI0033C10767
MNLTRTRTRPATTPTVVAGRVGCVKTVSSATAAGTVLDDPAAAGAQQQFIATTNHALGHQITECGSGRSAAAPTDRAGADVERILARWSTES